MLNSKYIKKNILFLLSGAWILLSPIILIVTEPLFLYGASVATTQAVFYMMVGVGALGMGAAYYFRYMEYTEPMRGVLFVLATVTYYVIGFYYSFGIAYLM